MGRKKKVTNPQETPGTTPAVEKATENPLIKKSIEHKSLECPLTADEISSYAKSLTGQLSRKEGFEAAHKSFSSQNKADINSCDEEIKRLMGRINAGHEFRSVECEVICDLEKKTKTTIRKDTGTVERVDPLSEAECQMEFPQPPAAPPAADPAPATETTATSGKAKDQLASNICITCGTDRAECINRIPTYEAGVIVKCSGYQAKGS